MCIPIMGSSKCVCVCVCYLSKSTCDETPVSTEKDQVEHSINQHLLMIQGLMILFPALEVEEVEEVEGEKSSPVHHMWVIWLGVGVPLLLIIGAVAGAVAVLCCMRRSVLRFGSREAC